MARNSIAAQARIDGIKAHKRERLKHKRHMRRHQHEHAYAARVAIALRAQVPAIVAAVDAEYAEKMMALSPDVETAR